MPEETSKATQRTVIGRTLSIGINVDAAKDLPQVGRYLAKFLKTVDHPHGPFDVDVAVSVGGGGLPVTVTVINAVDESNEEEDEEHRASN